MPQLLGKEIGPIGFGLMGFTWRANPCSQEQAFATMRAALENGDNFWIGGELYGTPEYNSLTLLERYFEKYPEDADKVVLSIKGGNHPDTHVADGSPENTRRTLDDCIAQLKGRKKIDIFEFARRDQNVPMEVTFSVIDKEYVQTGKIGGIMLSEVRVETIHEAVKHTKVLGVEAELSLICPDVLENGIAAACAKHGIPLIAYSPICRGMLTGDIKKYEDIPKDSNLQIYPRFHPGNLETNLQLAQQFISMAQKKGCTPAQFAINWTMAVSRRPGMPTIIPIPGATTVARVRENSKLIEISDDELAEIDAISAKFTVVGERYPPFIAMDT
ncbi:voltage-gated shaker-like K+ channel, subunit [Thozetella sp. PMI_491]|nr:voltage-gated shaker-like K+ channel, subunit [Thozetella sp. PMI_491]